MDTLILPSPFCSPPLYTGLNIADHPIFQNIDVGYFINPKENFTGTGFQPLQSLRHGLLHSRIKPYVYPGPLVPGDYSARVATRQSP